MDIWGKVWTDNDKNGHNKNGRMVKRMEKYWKVWTYDNMNEHMVKKWTNNKVWTFDNKNWHVTLLMNSLIFQMNIQFKYIFSLNTSKQSPEMAGVAKIIRKSSQNLVLWIVITLLWKACYCTAWHEYHPKLRLDRQQQSRKALCDTHCWRCL